METDKIHILHYFDRSLASVDHKWSHKSHSIYEETALLKMSFTLIKIKEAGHKWNRIILTSPWPLF